MVDYGKLTDEQQAAADALDRNVTLTAGAGTGKTTTLTARYMRMLERELASNEAGNDEPSLLPEGILTTTFTERAANELRESVRAAITDRAADAPPAEYAAWRTIADGLEDGYIHSLHGFCSRLLREHVLSVEGLEPGFDTLDQSETVALLDDTVATFLEANDDHDDLQTLARRHSRTDLQAILTDLLKQRPGGIDWATEWSEKSQAEYLEYVNSTLHPIPPETAAKRLATAEVVGAIGTLHTLVSSPPDAVDTGGQSWSLVEDALELLADIPYADGDPTLEKRDRFVELCAHLTSGGDPYKESTVTAAKGRWKGAEEAKERWDTAIIALIGGLEPETHQFSASLEADENSFPFVQALARVTKLVHEEYTERKRQRNAIDFTDQIEFAHRFLKKEASPELKAELREQFGYVMVDEFQDTDPRQWEIITHLTATDPEAFDARNVFIVGDVKQSIYRFRNADVTQFEATAQTLAKANPAGAESALSDDQLSTNFRTLPGVLGMINELFNETFDINGEPYEAPPQPLDPYREDPDGLAQTEYLMVPTDADYRARRFAEFEEFATADPEHDAELEAIALAARLTQLLDGSTAVYDEASDIDDPEPTELTPDDIAILLRSRTHLKKYERALEAEGIPFNVSSGLGFYDTPEITAMLNLFRALADPANERALYGVLRSPLFGLTDDTIAMLKADGAPLWEALSEADHEELQEPWQLLQGWREHLGVTPETTPNLSGSWAAFLTRIIDETGYLASISADERSAQAVANLDKFREQLRSYSDEGITSLATLVRQIERRSSLSDREGEATIQGGGDGVQIFTIHDAKGTEFPVVVVPAIGHGFNMRAPLGDGRAEFGEVDDSYAVGLKAPTPDDPFEMTGTVAREGLKKRRVAEERAEQKRTLYVACTRARDRLLLTGIHDFDSEDDNEGAPSLQDVKPADPEKADSWRDWVQPQLLTEDVLAGLEGTNRVTGSIKNASYTVSLPTSGVDWGDERVASTPEFELSPTPSQPERRVALSPTDLASLFDGYGGLQVDQRTNTVYYDGESAEETGGESDGSDGDLSPSVFGEMVHRLCELRPPTKQWETVMQRTLAAEDARVSLTPARHDRVAEHARSAIEYVDGVHADCDVEQTYDELAVTAEFDQSGVLGEVSGLIDHLAVTPTAYHIIDYKTNDIAAERVPEKAEYYRTQMEAYAVALHQQDPTRDVTAGLYFTTPELAHEFRWTPEELDQMEARIAERVAAEIDAEL